MKINRLFLPVVVIVLWTYTVNGQKNDVNSGQGFPKSDYTPFGYLDNPYHTFVLNRSGIIRSVPPIGFGYWCRRMPWPYGAGAQRQINYLSFIHLSVHQDGIPFHTAEDFKENDINLVSRYHSKNIMSYNWEFNGLSYNVKYFLPVENAILCLFEVENNTGLDKKLTLHATNIYGYPEQRWWGSDGVASVYNRVADAGISKIWAYGDIFAIGANAKNSSYKATASEEEWEKWISSNDLTTNEGASVKMPGPLYTVQSYQLNIGPGASKSLLIALSRGKNDLSVVKTHQEVLQSGREILKQKIMEDNDFYARVPLLTGNWPEAWKHGWIYDWETLRMNIRPPVGIYKHHWDGMQIFSPRSVMGETALDGMCMSYADIDLAKDMILGLFSDALMPNIPCSREDGSLNMIGADGRSCGTAPIWGVPFHMINSIYQRDQDDEWLKKLYPHLKSYLIWWMENRTDEEGWFHAANSWESGQDGSKRFLIPNHDPGAAADFVRTVDIEAAMAHAMQKMQSFANIVGQDQDIIYWKKLADKRVASAKSMFVDGWFRDFDARTDKPIILDNYYDIMMFLPVTLKIASTQQMKELEPMFYHFRKNPIHFMEWPSFLYPFTEAAWNAGLRMFNAEEVTKIGNRIYPRLDERHLQPILIEEYEDWLPEKYSFRIPGVSDEFWPISENNPGGCENYGWGATFPTLVIRNIIGFREMEASNANQFIIAPAVPDNLSAVGQSLGIKNLNFRNAKISVVYTLKKRNDLEVDLSCILDNEGIVTIYNEEGTKLASSLKEIKKVDLKFPAVNGHIYKVTID